MSVDPRTRSMELFSDHFGSAPEVVEEIGADASTRTYLRMVGSEGTRAIAGIGPDAEENRAFLSFSRSLRSAGLNVPEIYSADEAVGVWLEEDLGDRTLFAALQEARDRTGEWFPHEAEELYERVLEVLPRFQVEGGRVVDFSDAYPRSDFDLQSILWDLDSFKYHFLRMARVPFNEARLEADFRTLADFLLGADCDHFMYRDFQARNIMIRDGDPWFIDYQGGRRGALQYDVGSLLASATTDLPFDARGRLVEHYLDALEAHLPISREGWMRHYRGYVLVRVLQTLGTYGFQGLFERKSRFAAKIPGAARNLDRLLGAGLPVRLNELEGVLGRIVERWDRSKDAESTPDGLTVHLFSFSYKRGYPEAPNEHGGGFVFDCRALRNPGRESEYRPLSGLDPPVVRFLDGRPEAAEFWERARGLVESQVETYRDRGFRSLSVAFGCTGGQHRSVYFVERMARHLHERFPEVMVRLRHREASTWPEAATRPPPPDIGAPSNRDPSGGSGWTR